MKTKRHLAHIREIDGVREEQTLREHSIQAGKYASEVLKKIDLEYTGYFAGIIHDMGKARNKFEEYLEAAFRGENPHRGSVNHTYAAGKFILKEYGKTRDGTKEEAFRKQAAEIIAAAVCSHHALFDLTDPMKMNKEHGLAHRENYDEDVLDYEQVLENFFDEVISREELDVCFDKACEEINKKISIIRNHLMEYKKLGGVPIARGYLIRLISSAVIEGDRRDTAEFMSNKKIDVIQVNNVFWQEQLQFLETKIQEFPNKNTDLNIVRSSISEQCKTSAKRKPGIYRLSVPTGGGKTLASLRYAITHALEYEKNRIIFIIPLLSVLDQNSKELHKYIKDDNLILEHHSNAIIETDRKEELDEHELMMETWDSPIIISTLYQLLQNLFSHKMSAVRRMKSICNSVLVIDEIQSLPPKFNNIFSVAINFLEECCNCTVVLCSATQPAFEKLKLPMNISKDCELVEIDDKWEKIFDRTNVIDCTTPEGFSYEELADKVIEVINNKDSVLFICNTKKEAKTLFEMIKLMKPSKCEIYHLSTSMCKAHRSEVLTKIGKTPGLNEKRKVICVSTQMVEAGIDFSFECVMRMSAGLDNIVQSAGRCNRNMDWKRKCDAYVVNLKNESLGSLKSIKEGQDTVRRVEYFCENKRINYFEKTTVEKYYKELFETNYYIKEAKFPVEIDGMEYSILEMLSNNGLKGEVCGYFHKQAFKTAGKNCKVFDNEKMDVIVNRNDVANEHILNLTSDKGKHDITYAKGELNKLSQFTVSLFPWEVDKLMKDGMLYPITDIGMLILEEEAYNEETGINVGEYCYSKDDGIFEK